MFSAIVTAIGNLLTSIFNFRAEKIKNIASVEVVEDKQDYQKAVKTAEKIITIAENYKADMTFSHRLKFCHLVEDFRKNS